MARERRVAFGVEWTPANIVTVVRILFIPVFVAVFLGSWGAECFESAQFGLTVQASVSLVVFGAICLTDSLDGYLARSRNEITVFGKFMDPIADKVLVVAALLCLVELDLLPSWIPMVIVAREMLVSGLRMLVASAGVVVAASYLGKIKTATTMVAICLFVLLRSPLLAGEVWLSVSAWVLMYAAVLFTVVSMVDYFRKAWPLLAESKGPAPQKPRRAQESSFDWGTAEGRHDGAREVVERLIKTASTVCTVESCTGGLVGAALTSVSGSSAVVRGGAITYMADEKTRAVGVPPQTIECNGVVSSQTACAMAEGGLSTLGTTYCVSTTGIAGPGGATDEYPVGSVWIAVARKGGTVTAKLYRFEGSRTQVRAQAVDAALSDLLAALE